MNRKQRRMQGKVMPALPQAASIGPQTLFDQAVRHHQAGQIDDAQRLYRQVLQVEPRHADALHLLGLIAAAAGQNDLAVRLIGMAVRINGTVAPYHYNLGNALSELKRLDDAVLAYDTAIRLKPDYSIAHCSLGNALRERGRFDEAVAAYGAAIRIRPDFADAHANLGAVLRELGQLDRAVVAYDTAIRIQPGVARLHYNLGNALNELGRLDDALAAYHAAIRIGPDFAEAHSNLGNLLKRMGRLDDAIAAHETAIGIRPDYAEACSNLGNALGAAGRLDDAIAAYDAAIRIRPHFANAYSNLGNALTDIGRLDDAVAAHDTAIRIRPDFAEAHSNRLMGLHYHPGVGIDVILAGTRQYAERFETCLTPASFANPADPDRRLRIGYVSGDFGSHPVGHFLSPVLAFHDRMAVEVFCYANGTYPGEVARRLRDVADHWRNLAGLSDTAAAELVTSDGIDILVDLSGHTGLNRLPMFARRPAPVQATWLGYWGTTGLSRMDFILSDATTIPPGSEAGYTERVLRLPNCRFCYKAPDHAPLPAPSPPCLRNGHVTFGSFNNLAKVGPEMVRLWADVLRATPGSRLLLKWKSLADAGMRRRLAEAFEAAGIAPARLELRGASLHRAMLDEYGDVDIALDPCPFSGGLTSCEALWMGVPVVTLPGPEAQSRQTSSFLHAIGYTDWVATSRDDYIRIAVALAADHRNLDRLRHDLRRCMAASPLCDGAAFTRGLEAAYRSMWRSWCA